MSIGFIVTAIISGLFIGFLIGLTGVGGGVLIMPVLMRLLHLDPTTAVGTASFYSVIIKMHATFEHFRLKSISYRNSFLFLAGALPGNIIASFFIKSYKSGLNPQELDSFQNVIRIFITGVIFFSLGTMIVNYFAKKKSDVPSEDMGKNTGPVRIITGIGASLLIGALMGATSIGGGVLVIPTLIVLFSENKKYVGSSILIALIIMVATSIIYAFAGGKESSDVNFITAALLAIGSFFGVRFGSIYSNKISAQKQQLFVILTISLAAVMMVFDLFLSSGGGPVH